MFKIISLINNLPDVLKSNIGWEDKVSNRELGSNVVVSEEVKELRPPEVIEEAIVVISFWLTSSFVEETTSAVTEESDAEMDASPSNSSRGKVKRINR